MKDVLNNAVGPQLRKKGAAKTQRAMQWVTGFSLVAGFQTATQTFAHTFNYQDALGLHWGPVYAPWSIVSWSTTWYGQYTADIQHAVRFGLLVAGAGLLTVAIINVIQSNSSQPNPYLHGSARWANTDDLCDAGLFVKPRGMLRRLLGKARRVNTGVYVGATEDKNGKLHYLRHSGPEHVLCFAPTRSGKGVGLVLPTLLSWAESAVITDLKGELWAMTAGWRQQYAKNKVIKFEPAVLGSAQWNPLDEIRLDTTHEVGDVQNLATLIVDPNGKGMDGADAHWQKTAKALLVGVILHVLYKAKNGDLPVASLGVVDALLADPDQGSAELWADMKNYAHCNGQVHPTVARAATDMIDRDGTDELGSILSSTKSHLELYRDPTVEQNTSRSDFCIKDLMHHDNPVSLYIVTQPADKDRLRPLVRVLINMIVRLLADKMEFESVTKPLSTGQKIVAALGFQPSQRTTKHSKKDYKHRLLGMIDEFPSLGKLDILQESLAYVAGYGIKFYLICQDLPQLKSRERGYGPDETITSNCHVQNAYPPNRVETAEHLSRLTGTTTIIKQSVTTSGKRASALLSNVSKTTTEVQRPLLTPDECLRMPGPKKNAEGMITEAGDMVVYVAGFPAVYGKQPLYFQDETFLARAGVAEPKTTDRLSPIVDKEAV